MILAGSALAKGQERRISQRKIRDRSIALVLAGIVALMPPIAGVALIDAKLFGLPVALIYIFAVWALLIVGATMLARPLRDSDVDTSSADLGEPR